MTATVAARRLVPALAVLAGAAVLASATLAGGCSESSPAQPDLSAELMAIRDSLDASRDSTDRLATELQRQGRRIGDLSRRVDGLDARVSAGTAQHPAGHANAADGTSDGAGEAGVAAQPAAELASEVAAVLASEDGRKVVAAAARGALKEREASRRDAFVAYSLETFADEAGLTETQTRDMRKAWDDVMAGARKVMREAAPTPDMTPEERAESVRKIREGMQALGKRREERMRTILDDTQYELYEEREDEIDAGIHGAPGAGERRTETGDPSQR